MMKISISFLLLLVCALLQSVPSTYGIERPNVIFIVADDMGYSDMGTQGARGFKTPHLDQLAAEGQDSHDSM